MAKEIKIKAVLEDKISGQVNTMTNNVSNATKKSTSAVDKFSSNLIKKFFGVQAAIQAAKKTVDFMVDSFKAFEKASGGNTLTRLQQQFGQLQVEIGSALAPSLTELAGWFERNAETIQKVGRVIANVLVVSIQYLIKYFNQLKLTFATITGLLVEAVVEPINLVVGAINKLVSIIPDKFIPDEWKEGLSSFSGGLSNFTEVNRKVVSQIGKEWADGAKDIGKTISGIFKDPGKSGVKYRTDKEIKESEDAVKIEEKNLKELEALYANFENTFRGHLEDFRKESMYYSELRRQELAGWGDKEKAEIITNYKIKLHNAEKERDGILAVMEKAWEKEISMLEEKFSVEERTTEEYYKKINAINEKYGNKGFSVRGFYRHKKGIIEKEYQGALGGLENQREIDYMETGKEQIEKEIQAQSMLRDISIASMTDRFEREKAIAGASFTENLSALEESCNNKLISEEEYLVASELLYKTYNNNLKQIDADRTQSYFQSLYDQMNKYAEMGAMIKSIADNILNYQMECLKEETQSRIDYVNANVKGEKTKAREIAKINKEAEREEKKIRKVQMIGDMIQAVANTALGITRALTQTPPASYIMAALTGVAGAVQVGIIGAQMAKLASGGVIPGQKNSGDKTIASVNAGEMVLNNDQQRRLFDIASGRVQPSGSGIVFNETITVQGNLDMNAAEKVRVDREKQIKDFEDTLREMQYRNRIQPVLF